MYKLKIRGEYMSINKCKLISVLLLSFCIGFFINISDVRAIGTPDGNGYADCEYKVAHQVGSNQGREYVIRINVFRNTEGNYDGYAITACGNTTIGSSTWSEKNCSIANYDEMFSRSDLESWFRPDGKWICPPIWLKNPLVAGGNDILDDITLSYTDKSGIGSRYNKIDNITNYSSESGAPSDHTGEYEGQQTGDYHDTQSDEQAAGKNKGATREEIERWGGLASYNTLGELGDVNSSCSVVRNNSLLTSILRFVFWAISIGGILVLIIMTVLDFVKAVTASDDAGLKKAFQHLVKRAIAAVVLLLLPMIVSFIINIINGNAPETLNGTVQIGEDGELYCDVVESD